MYVMYLIIAVCPEIHTKHLNTLCGQNLEFVNVKTGGTQSDRILAISRKIQSRLSTPTRDQFVLVCPFSPPYDASAIC